jgi:RNA polymerase sigma factor (sigma-70 family)
LIVSLGHMTQTVRPVATFSFDLSAGKVDLIAGALRGDRLAWEELTRLTRCIVAKALRGFDASVVDRDEVLGATLETVVAKLSALREPDAVLGWIGVVARNHALRIIRRSREVPTDEDIIGLRSIGGDFVDDLDLDLHATWQWMVRAINDLKPVERQLLTLLIEEPDLSYAEVARRLGRPVGSIGPTRQRTLAKLRAAAPVMQAA